MPANAQSPNRIQCFFQTDNSRLTGYYDVCPDNVLQTNARRSLTVVTAPPVVTVRDNNRDSGGDGAGGGGGGR